MKIHQLPADPGRQQKIKRVGRGEGSGHGKTSGYGHKGSQARSGRGKGYNAVFEGGQMPLVRRLPKGGFKNPFRVEYQVVNLGDLDKSFEKNATVDAESLKKAGLIGKVGNVKILGNGELTKALKITAHKASASAVEKIEKAGGSFSVVPKPEAKKKEAGAKKKAAPKKSGTK
ncbi:MAG TPA: 50S ribosomal protein L15 [Candidatus Sumerlaeota bacterium]|nr:50S ribosomal protein L15 [Candidatus Sumerlaeota bacterium]